MKMMLEIPAVVIRKAKAGAAQEGLPLEDYLSRIITRASAIPSASRRRQRVKLPLVRGGGRAKINPSREQLDAGLWD